MINFHNISKKKIFGFVFIVVLLVIIPLTVFIAQKQQETRQRASGEQTTLSFADEAGNSVSQLSFLTDSVISSRVVSLYLDTQGETASGFDITLKAIGENPLCGFRTGSGQCSTFENYCIEQTDDAHKFNIEVLNTVKDNGKTFRFAKVNTNASEIIQGRLKLLQYRAGRAQCNIVVENATITSPTSTNALSTTKPTLSIVEITPTPTSVPPTETPTPTTSGVPIETSTPGPPTSEGNGTQITPTNAPTPAQTQGIDTPKTQPNSLN